MLDLGALYGRLTLDASGWTDSAAVATASVVTVQAATSSMAATATPAIDAVTTEVAALSASCTVAAVSAEAMAAGTTEAAASTAAAGAAAGAAAPRVRSVDDASRSASVGMGLMTAAATAAVTAVAVAAAGFAAFGAGLGSVMEAGSQMESFETRLTTMMGSAKDAHERLQELVQFAATTPFDIPGVVGAEVTLQAFGADSKAIMKGLIDFAAGSGTELGQAAIDLGKAWNQGAVAMESDGAKMLRSMIQARTGIDATKMSIEDFREALQTELSIGKFAGAAMALSTTWEGIASNMEDNWGSFKRAIADAGVFNNVKLFLGSMLNLINQNQEAIGKLASLISSALWEGFKLIVQGVAEAIDLTEAWAFIVAKVAQALVQAGADYLRVTLDIVNALAVGAEAIGLSKDAALLDGVGDRLNAALVATNGMAAGMGEWAASIDITNDKLGTTTALLQAAEATAKLISIGGGSATGKGATAATAAGGIPADVQAWFDAMTASITTSVDQMSADLETAGDNLDEGLGALTKAVADYEQFWKSAKDQAIGSLGDLGGIIQAGIAGAASAGPAGAAAGVGLAALGSSEAFSNLVSSLNEMVATLVAALDPVIHGVAAVLGPALLMVGTLLDALAPIFDFVGNILMGLAPVIMVIGAAFHVVGALFSTLESLLTPVMPILDTAFRALFEVLKAVAEIILYVMLGIQTAWNAIVGAVAGILAKLSDVFGGALDGLVEKLEGMKADTTSTEQALGALTSMTYESAYEQANLAANAATTAATMEDVTEALTNVPSGYKVASARFDAIAADAAQAMDLALAATMGATTASTGGSGGTRGGGSGPTTGGRRRSAGPASVTVNIGEAKLSAMTVTDLAVSGMAEADKRRKALTGMPMATAGRFIAGRRR